MTDYSPDDYQFNEVCCDRQPVITSERKASLLEVAITTEDPDIDRLSGLMMAGHTEVAFLEVLGDDFLTQEHLIELTDKHNTKNAIKNWICDDDEKTFYLVIMDKTKGNELSFFKTDEHLAPEEIETGLKSLDSTNKDLDFVLALHKGSIYVCFNTLDVLQFNLDTLFVA